MPIIDKSLSLRNRNKMLLGVYDDEEKVMAASASLVNAGVRVHDVYTPFPIHGLDRIIGVRRTWLTVVAFLCGFTGFSLAFTMIWYMYVYDWPLDIGNKPVNVITPSWVPILFESTVLCTAFGMAFFFFWRNRLAHGIKAELLDERQTDDRIIIAVETQDAASDSEIIEIMKKNGALELREKVGGVQTTI